MDQCVPIAVPATQSYARVILPRLHPCDTDRWHMHMQPHYTAGREGLFSYLDAFVWVPPPTARPSSGAVSFACPCGLVMSKGRHGHQYGRTQACTPRSKTWCRKEVDGTTIV